MRSDAGVVGMRGRTVSAPGPSSTLQRVPAGDRVPAGQARPSGDGRVSGAIAREPGSGALRWLLLGALVLVGLTALGASYYFAPVALRVRSPLHPWLRPSGYVGQVAGFVALLILLTLWLYPLRRRFRSLAFLGAMSAGSMCTSRWRYCSRSSLRCTPVGSSVD
jgi:hypothetical protein